MKILRYLRTIRYLKLSQVYYRLKRRAYFTNHYNKLPPPEQMRARVNRPIAYIESRPSAYGKNSFSFLNKYGVISDWDAVGFSDLWRYNLHYFDYLNSVGSSNNSILNFDLLRSWVKYNTPSVSIGWDPYPTSLRIVNWIKYYLAGNTIPPECLQSLGVQTRWLYSRIELHLLGNHVIANAKALIYSGVFFQCAEAENWLNRGLSLLDMQIKEQVLLDGGHFELSPMYHSIILVDLLDIINISTIFPGVIPCKTIQFLNNTSIKMLEWLCYMCHPDGDISFFNDAAKGIAPKFNEIQSYANRLGVKSKKIVLSYPIIKHLQSTGYVRINIGGACLIIDVANIGPGYIPGHAHADTLSFEMSLFGKRFLVNTGTSEYCEGDIRSHERGTGSHNTVQVASYDSSEVWKSFRVGRRASPFDLLIREVSGTFLVDCSHDGYKFLLGKPVHRRCWQVSDGKLVIEDYVHPLHYKGISRLHFHPDVNLICRNEREILAEHFGHSVLINVLFGRVQIKQYLYSYEFGVREPAKFLELELTNEYAKVEIIWTANDK